jgi:hypothetical protein
MRFRSLAAALAVLVAAHTPVAAQAASRTGVGVADPPPLACADTAGVLDGAALVGSPRRTVGGVPEAGVVEVRPKAGTPVTLTSASVGVPLQSRGWFGASVDLNSVTSGDRCRDLLIGMPGLNGAKGGVVVVPDFGKGLEPGAAQWLPTTTLALKLGDQLGATVAAAGALALAGSPGRDAAAAPDAGALVSWVISTNHNVPSRAVSAAAPVTYVQGTAGILGHAEAGDRFGSVLYLSGIEEELTAAVGIPDEDIGRAKDAGAVALLTWGYDGRWWGDNQLLWQGHGRTGWYALPGKSRAGDRLGAAVNYDDKRGAFGMPGKDANGRKNSGAVLVWKGNLATGNYRVVTQNTKGVPDKSERGDAFGSAIIERQDCWPCRVLVIGAPGENRGKRRDAGSVTHLMVEDKAGNPTSKAWRQPAAGLATGDQFGSRLLGDWWKGTQGVLVGAPGFDRPGAPNAGRYYQAGVRSLVPVSTGTTPGERLGG